MVRCHMMALTIRESSSPLPFPVTELLALLSRGRFLTFFHLFSLLNRYQVAMERAQIFLNLLDVVWGEIEEAGGLVKTAESGAA